MTFEEFDTNIDKEYINQWHTKAYWDDYKLYKCEQNKKHRFECTTCFTYSYDIHINDFLRRSYYNIKDFSLDEIKEMYKINVEIWKNHKLLKKLNRIKEDFE